MEDTLTKYFSGELNRAEEMTMFLQMKNDEQLRQEYIRLQNIYALTRLAPDPKQESEGKEGFSTFTRRMNEKKRQRRMRFLLQYAAISLLLIASTIFLTRA